jgi:hypothetical protein
MRSRSATPCGWLLVVVLAAMAVAPAVDATARCADLSPAFAALRAPHVSHCVVESAEAADHRSDLLLTRPSPQWAAPRLPLQELAPRAQPARFGVPVATLIGRRNE